MTELKSHILCRDFAHFALKMYSNEPIVKSGECHNNAIYLYCKSQSATVYCVLAEECDPRKYSPLDILINLVRCRMARRHFASNSLMRGLKL